MQIECIKSQESALTWIYTAFFRIYAVG